MNIEDFTVYCSSKRSVSTSFPFGGDTLVFKVLNKIFALTGLDESPCKVNLKCDPERALSLREEYWEIKPGYHMNKKHWNTIELEANLSDDLIKSLIDHSYDLVVSSLPKKDKIYLESL